MAAGSREQSTAKDRRRRLVRPATARDRWLVAVALLCLVWLVGGCGDDGVDGAATDATPQARQKTYQSALFGFSMTYDTRRFEVVDEVATDSSLMLTLGESAQADGPIVIRLSLTAAGEGMPRYTPGTPQADAALRAQFEGFKEDFAEARLGEPQEYTLAGLPGLVAAVGGAVPALPIDDPQLVGKVYGTLWEDGALSVLAGAPSSVWAQAEQYVDEVVRSISLDAATDD